MNRNRGLSPIIQGALTCILLCLIFSSAWAMHNPTKIFVLTGEFHEETNDWKNRLLDVGQKAGFVSTQSKLVGRVFHAGLQSEKRLVLLMSERNYTQLYIEVYLMMRRSGTVELIIRDAGATGFTFPQPSRDAIDRLRIELHEAFLDVEERINFSEQE